MEKFNWKETIRLNILKLKIIGLWPKGNETYKLNLYALWTLISVGFFIFSHNFFQAVNIYFIKDDIKAVTGIIFLNLSELLGIIKSYYMIQNMKILKQMMITLESEMFQPKNDRQKKIIEPQLRLYKIIYVIFWSMSVGAIFFWITIPFLTNSVKDHRLPFMAWYPFDTTVSPNYEITYIYQAFAVICVAVSTLSVDTLIAALNMYIGAQLDILCDDLRHLENTPQFNSKFLHCIQHHKEILRFANNSRKCFNWIVLLQFFISATSIGITLFQMTVVEPFGGEFVSLLSFELAIVVEIFMYCWFGNEVEQKSKQIPYAIFQSEWINAPIEAKKNIIIFVFRCQRPIRISAFNLVYLSLETFMKIIRASWSYFALLNQMTSRK